MKKVFSFLFFLGLLFGLVNYAFTQDDISNLQDGYEALFTHGILHDIEIVISQEEWDGLVQDMKDYAEEFNGSVQTGNYRKADFIYKGPAGDTVIDEIGFRTKGRASRVIPQDDNGTFHRAHFKVKFNETFDLEPGTEEYQERDDRRFCRLRKLILRVNIDPGRIWDNSQIRELYCYDLLRRGGAYTSRTGSSRLTITIGGELHYFGIYTLIEPIDKSFLTKRYGKDANDGNLYKCDVLGQGGAATLNSLENYPAFKRNNPSFVDRLVGVKDWEINYRPTYDLKTNEDAPDHTALLSFLDNLNSLNGEDLKQYLDENFEVDRFLRYQAMNVLLGKWDDYWTFGNNYYLYFNNRSKKIEFISYDYDMAIGGGLQFFYTPSIGIYDWEYQWNANIAMNTRLPLSYINWLFPPGSPLVDKMFEIDEYRQIYEGYFKEFITPSNKLFVYSDYEAKFNQFYQLYADHLDNDIDEGEEMINEQRTGKYFFERTKSVIDELGLDGKNYETKPLSLPPPTEFSATDGLFPFVIMITWDPVPYADYYRVYRSDSSDGIYEQIGETITLTSFNDQSVTVDTTYYYKVKAFTTDGIESDFSLEDAGSTNDGTIKPPTGVSATDGTYNHMVTVSWEDVLNADYYKVYRSGSFGDPYEEISDKVRTLNFNDQSAVVNSAYYYRVQAFTNAGAETEFSTEDEGYASDSGLGPPEIIKGSSLFRGTYANRSEAGTTVYTFKFNKTCKKSTRNASGRVSKSSGEWGYNANGKTLTVDTAVSVGAAGIRFIEVWENAYTTYGGSVLNLLGLRKIVGDQDGILGKYEGGANINVEMGAGVNLFSFKMKLVLSINEDGTWDMETTADTNGEIEITTATGSGYPNRLIEFNGAYYMSVFGFLYTKRAIPVIMPLKNWEYSDNLRNLEDHHLQATESLDLSKFYDTIVLELLSVLSQNPQLENRLNNSNKR